MNNLALLLTLLVAAPVLADNNQADLNASGAHYTGNLMINQASGTQQQQVNSRAIAIGNQAQSTAGVTQQLTGQADPAMNARAALAVTRSARAAACWGSTSPPVPTTRWSTLCGLP